MSIEQIEDNFRSRFGAPIGKEANVPKEKRNFIKSQPTLDHPTISK